MAIVDNPLLGDVRGRYGTGVFCQLKGRTILRSRPVMWNRKLSERQLAQNKKFVEGRLEAHRILHDPVRRAEYDAKCGPGYSLYHRVMREVMKE